MFNPDGCYCCQQDAERCKRTYCRWFEDNLENGVVDTDSKICSAGVAATAVVTNAQDLANGNTAPSREITIETTGAAPASTAVYGVVLLQDAKYNPYDAGELQNVTICCEAQKGAEQAGTVNEIVLAVKQDGKVFVTEPTSLTGSWKLVSGKLYESDFSEVKTTQLAPDSSSHPDFSRSGTCIQFGVAIRTIISSGTTDIENNCRVDNICIYYTGSCCDPGKQYAITFTGITLSGPSSTTKTNLQAILDSTTLVTTDSSGCTGITLVPAGFVSLLQSGEIDEDGCVHHSIFSVSAGSIFLGWSFTGSGICSGTFDLTFGTPRNASGITVTLAPGAHATVTPL